MIAIIDYGMGNLHSVAKALEQLGEKVIITSSPGDLCNAQKIVLPGVGTFTEGMKNLQNQGFIPVLEEEVLRNKKPFLGICLGMQLLAERGEENGSSLGLGWLPFSVPKFKVPANTRLRIPHMGWDEIQILKRSALFQGTPSDTAFYFVHSYHLQPQIEQAKEYVMAWCDYGYPFPAALQKENIFAVQFHPEKSQKEGLRLLQNFVNWKPELEIC